MNLAVKWREVVDNPFFRDIPYKVELNKFGQILMSPASNRHGILQNKVARGIEHNKRSGVVIIECSILTSEGVRVADVAWASDEFMAEFGETTPYLKAPEICVEIKSPANSKAEMAEKLDFIWKKELWKFGLWMNTEKQISSHISEKSRNQKLSKILIYKCPNK